MDEQKALQAYQSAMRAIAQAFKSAVLATPDDANAAFERHEDIKFPMLPIQF